MLELVTGMNISLTISVKVWLAVEEVVTSVARPLEQVPGLY